MASNTLVPPRIVFTTHTAEGVSKFLSDEQATPFQPFGPRSSAFYNFDANSRVPVSNTASLPTIAQTIPRCPANGVNFVCVDYQPGSSAPMHRTESMDYGVVLSGEVVLSLDGAEEKTLKAGDFVVQRGTNHEWHNRTSSICRMMFVMVSAEKIVLENGQVLEETVLKI